MLGPMSPGRQQQMQKQVRFAERNSMSGSSVYMDANGQKKVRFAEAASRSLSPASALGRSNSQSSMYPGLEPPGSGNVTPRGSYAYGGVAGAARSGVDL